MRAPSVLVVENNPTTRKMFCIAFELELMSAHQKPFTQDALTIMVREVRDA